jgi:hypothetical protein
VRVVRKRLQGDATAFGRAFLFELFLRDVVRNVHKLYAYSSHYTVSDPHTQSGGTAFASSQGSALKKLHAGYYHVIHALYVYGGQWCHRGEARSGVWARSLGAKRGPSTFYTSPRLPIYPWTSRRSRASLGVNGGHSGTDCIKTQSCCEIMRPLCEYSHFARQETSLTDFIYV